MNKKRGTCLLLMIALFSFSSFMEASAEVSQKSHTTTGDISFYGEYEKPKETQSTDTKELKNRETVRTNLPQTGEQSTPSYFIIGMIVFVGSYQLYQKNKIGGFKNEIN